MIGFEKSVWNATNIDRLHEQLREARDRVTKLSIDVVRLKDENEKLRVKLEKKPMAEKNPEDWTLDEVVGVMLHCSCNDYPCVKGTERREKCPLKDDEKCVLHLMFSAAKMLQEMAG